MPLVRVHGGDFPGGYARVYRFLLAKPRVLVPRGLLRSRAKYVLATGQAAVQIADASSSKSFCGTAVAGFAGGFLLGVPGLLAGVLAGGNKRRVAFACRFADGKHFVGSCDRRTFETYFMPLVGAALPSEQPVPAIPPADHIADLERLASLRDRGVLSAAEFEAQKGRLLAGRAAA